MSKIIDEYLQIIYKKCEPKLKSDTTLDKISDYDIIVPSNDNLDILTQYNYNKEQLKIFAKHYKLKVSGNKKELSCRIYCFLKLSRYITKIQKIVRGRLQRKYNLSHGPAFLDRSLCNNNTDFFTMDDIADLPCKQFFSYKDDDNFIYGFDIISLYNLLKKEENEPKNPYNRRVIPLQAIVQLRTMLRLSKLLKIPINVDIKDVFQEVSSKKSIELRILDLFQSMDALGNYSNSIWFTSLTRNQLIKFIRELVDIWTYRTQLTVETKRAICPPNGDPFRNINSYYIHNEPNLDNVRKLIVEVLEKLVNSGIDNDSRALGTYYVLGSLTLVNQNAAEALPWLFQSFSYF